MCFLYGYQHKHCSCGQSDPNISNIWGSLVQCAGFLNYMQTFLLNELRLGGSWWYMTYVSSLKICFFRVVSCFGNLRCMCSTSLISLNYNLNALTSPLASLPYLSVGVSNEIHLFHQQYLTLLGPKGERSFHIFYQALAAANGGDEEINLEGFQGYRADARLLFWGYSLVSMLVDGFGGKGAGKNGVVFVCLFVCLFVGLGNP